MYHNRKGQVIVPTGGGKTLCMIVDAVREFARVGSERKTIIVVAPRILLAQQLSSDFIEYMGSINMLPTKVLHVHSGETQYDSTTNAEIIKWWGDINSNYNKLIFTTYHSLHRIQESGISVNTIYFDEAHNSVQRHFFPATEFFANMDDIRCYFFTATPCHSSTIAKPGMNDVEVYGKVISKIGAPHLVNKGYILPPKVIVKELEMVSPGKIPAWKDADNILETIDEQRVGKILICARRTSQIVNLIEQTEFCSWLESRGYSWMYITSKTGACIDGNKVDREKFFETLNAWGKDDKKKFVVLHHSILSEGINVHGLEAALFLRNMNHITISQTIGRIIRKGSKKKKVGLICIPVYDRVGISTSRKVETIVDTIFNKGEPAISTIKK